MRTVGMHMGQENQKGDQRHWDEEEHPHWRRIHWARAYRQGKKDETGNHHQHHNNWSNSPPIILLTPHFHVERLPEKMVVQWFVTKKLSINLLGSGVSKTLCICKWRVTRCVPLARDTPVGFGIPYAWDVASKLNWLQARSFANLLRELPFRI